MFTCCLQIWVKFTCRAHSLSFTSSALGSSALPLPCSAWICSVRSFSFLLSRVATEGLHEPEQGGMGPAGVALSTGALRSLGSLLLGEVEGPSLGDGGALSSSLPPLPVGSWSLLTLTEPCLTSGLSPVPSSPQQPSPPPHPV